MIQTKFLRLLTIILTVSTLSAFMSACKKEAGVIGLDLMDENNLSTGYSDTLTIHAHAVLLDSIRADETSVNVLGSFWDPVFGLTTADLVAELWMTENSPNFGTSPVADSMIVYLSYTGSYYGDTTSMLQGRIYELDEDIEVDSTYYSNRRCQYIEQPVGEFAFYPMPTDSVMDPDSSMGAARISIPLELDFAQRILDADTANFSDNPAFSDFMRGLYIQFDPAAGPGQGSLIDINLLNTRSKTVLYYHNTTDTTTFEIRTSTYSPRYGQIAHDYTSADPVFLQQITGDTTTGSEKLYVQGLGGVKTVFHMPHLSDIGDATNTAFNEAKLVMSVYNGDTTYPVPANLEVMMIDEDGERVLIPDYSEGATYYGGYYNQNAGTYTFRITRYLQHVINGDIEDKGLELVISGGSINAERLVLHGTSPLENPGEEEIRFRAQIIVTSIEN